MTAPHRGLVPLQHPHGFVVEVSPERAVTLRSRGYSDPAPGGDDSPDPAPEGDREKRPRRRTNQQQ